MPAVSYVIMPDVGVGSKPATSQVNSTARGGQRAGPGLLVCCDTKLLPSFESSSRNGLGQASQVSSTLFSPRQPVDCLGLHGASQ